MANTNLEVAVNNQTRTRVDKKLVKTAVGAVLRGEARKKSEFGMAVSVVFVGVGRIRALNKKYRRIDAPTDVLSFCESEAAGFPADNTAQRKYLGEIVINLDQVKKNARAGQKTDRAELAWVVIHGILHLIGFDHKKAGEAAVMRKKEAKYLSAIGLKTR